MELGKQSRIPTDPDNYVLQCVDNKFPHRPYVARFTCPEFTSLCPVTGQPDFATFVIDYIPDKWLVESKSLKLFLFSFRNYGDYHESCTLKIANKIIYAAVPHFLRISAFWYPRGGIPIDVFFQDGHIDPEWNIRLPDVEQRRPIQGMKR